MGGLNETLVPKPEKKKGKVEKVRAHLDNTTGEMHFHDQNIDPRRTVEVPVSIWYRVWQELQTLQRMEWEFLDAKNGTLLTIKVTRTVPDKPDEPVQVDMEFDVLVATVNETFTALANVSKRTK